MTFEDINEIGKHGIPVAYYVRKGTTLEQENMTIVTLDLRVVVHINPRPERYGSL